MQVHLAEHLPKNKQIQKGSYYTPKELVDRVHEFIQPYLDNKKNVVIFDSAGGCGAFLVSLKHYYDYRIADCDLDACNFLKQHFEQDHVFHTNSLTEVDRTKYRIGPAAFLIMIGNPPYNDTTSEFKHGQKGRNICDNDLYDRDLGVSFLKSYNKFKADIVCVLHPLSYLIKETNFKRLREFKDNYRLVRGEIFSSALFHGTGTGKFPILVALYEKNPSGMTFDYIRRFCFDILNSPKKFVLSKYNTTDGYINKYPPRKNDIKDSPIGLYYYTFRDFNSLKKNASFIVKKHPNGIVVMLENFYKYAYLYALKNLFRPEDPWLYGNLSPLVNIDDVEKSKKLYVSYAIRNNHIFDNIKETCKEIAAFYKVKLNNESKIDCIEKKTTDKFKNLV
ncbi:MAG: hypothetical protein DRZ76_00140 [Candidatus Nealsonbacteria bacterium]|nr:MAG: hypothetical protein DRZ76_00140 [Candidatus Nealsonbacteria bacterium]